MNRTGRVGILGILFLSAMCSGCMNEHHTATAPPEVPLDIQAAQQMPQAAKNRVHVVFVSSLTGITGLSSLRQELIGLGFIKSYSGHNASLSCFTAALREAHEREPDARFAVVAHSGGASLVPDLVQQMIADGLIVDLCFYIDPSHTPPPLPIRTVNMATKDRPMEGAENLKVDTHSLLITKHPAVRTVLLRELVEISSRVTVMGVERTLPVGLVVPREWEFIKPDGAGHDRGCCLPISAVENWRE